MVSNHHRKGHVHQVNIAQHKHCTVTTTGTFKANQSRPQHCDVAYFKEQHRSDGMTLQVHQRPTESCNKHMLRGMWKRFKWMWLLFILCDTKVGSGYTGNQNPSAWNTTAIALRGMGLYTHTSHIIYLNDGHWFTGMCCHRQCMSVPVQRCLFRCFSL
jgi:hypothetical protein